MYKHRQTRGLDQDGRVDRDASLPWTTKRRITTNLKTKPTRTARKWNCKEVWHQGVKEETITQTSMRVRYRKPGWRGPAARQQTWQARQQLADGISHIWEQISQAEQLRSKTDHAVTAWGNKASKPVALETYEGCSDGRNSQLHKSLLERFMES